MNYYMGMIVLQRSHPSMPPAPWKRLDLLPHKRQHANQIGRIAAGLTDDSSQLIQISTLLGAAFIESSFCLFVGGIQVGSKIVQLDVVRELTIPILVRQ